MDEIIKMIKNERDFFDSKMKNFEHADKINNYIATTVKHSREKIELKYDYIIRDIKGSLAKIWKDNLRVPNLIGEAESAPYKNLGQYLEFLNENNAKVEESITVNSHKCALSTQTLRTKIIKIREDVIEKLNKERKGYREGMEDVQEALKVHEDKASKTKAETLRQLTIMHKTLKNINPESIRERLEKAAQESS